VEAQDLAELVGNLAENAVKWAAKRVRISARPERRDLALSVDDDGPGVPEDRIATVLARGGRLDEAQPGTGLGLAIAGDLAEAYGGSLRLGRSSLGGLRASVVLPGAAA
jgi:signal transduction histidine kinase